MTIATSPPKKRKKRQNRKLLQKTALGELNLVQESLRKALQNKRKSLAAPALSVPLDVVEDCKEPTTEDIDKMLEAVFNNCTSPSTEEDNEEAEDKDTD